MLSATAEAGHAGRLDGLPDVFDLRACGVRGEGYPLVDERHPPGRMSWSRRLGEFTFLDQNHDEGAFQALERFNAEAVALGGRSIQTDRIRDRLLTPVKGELTKSRLKLHAYNTRMKYLRDQAVEDGYTLNLASEVGFRQFIGSASDIRRGNLVLMDNGNLRAIWKDDKGNRLGLQFLGGRMVQYVIFKRRKEEEPFSRVVGRDSLEGLKRQIEAFELYSLLCE